MSEWRVKLLMFMEQRPVLISVIQSTVLAATSIPAFMIEQQNGCVDIIRLWLIGALIRVWLRMLDSFWFASLTGQPVASSSVKCAYMWQECLDVFGVMWQILMSIVVFNNGQCAYKSPLIYAGSLIYLFGTYTYVGIYLFIVRSLTLRPPSAPEDVLYLANLREAAIDLRNQLSNSPPQNATRSQAATHIDPNAWGAWLESYGSFAVPYEKSELSHSHRSRAGTGTTDRTDSLGSRASGGDVELGRVSGGSGGMVDADITQDGSAYATIYSQQTPLDAHNAKVDVTKAKTESDQSSGQNNTQTMVNSTAVDSLEVCAICLNNYVNPTQPKETESKECENQHVVVRYPCAGNHYFHAHCLHQWLQADAVRRTLQPRRVVGPVVNSDVRALVTCPICREHPSMLKESEQSVHQI